MYFTCRCRRQCSAEGHCGLAAPQLVQRCSAVVEAPHSLTFISLASGNWSPDYLLTVGRSQSILSCVIIFWLHVRSKNQSGVCLSFGLFFFWNVQAREPFSQSYITLSQLEVQHFSQICQQCVLKSLSVGSCSPWTQPSSIFTVWGLTGSKRGPFQHLLTSVPVGLETPLLSHHFHTQLIEESRPQRSLNPVTTNVLLLLLSSWNKPLCACLFFQRMVENVVVKHSCAHCVAALLNYRASVIWANYLFFFVPTSNPKYLTPPSRIGCVNSRWCGLK